jgi:hypothetical protein
MTDTYTPVLTESDIILIAGRVDDEGGPLMDFARAIERAAIEAYQRQQWISVEDRLPPDDETWVYAMHIDGVPEIVCGCLIHETRPDGAYSHWMPLPPAPDLHTATVDNLVENPMTDLRQRGLARVEKTLSGE